VRTWADRTSCADEVAIAGCAGEAGGDASASILGSMTVSVPVRGILFDSGDTLVRPLGGAWFPGHLFREILDRHGAGDLAWGRLETALAAGYRHLGMVQIERI